MSWVQAKGEMGETAQQEILSLITTDTAVAWTEGNQRDDIHSLTSSSPMAIPTGSKGAQLMQPNGVST